VAALVLGLGPGLVLVNQSIIGLPLALVALVPGSELLRFPVRLLWVWFLCGSTVAALTLSAMVQNLGSARRGLLHGSLLMACLLVDVFAVVRLPLRQQVQSVTTPSAYLSGEGPVLDLYPEVLGTRVDWSQWFQGLACLYQVGHGRAIADHCVVTHPESNPRTRLTRQVTADLLSERTQQVSGQLRDLGYTAIAWHPDLFQPGDRVRLARSLDVLDSEPVRSTDGAEHVVVYRLENG
jgi:hypothetical protein